MHLLCFYAYNTYAAFMLTPSYDFSPQCKKFYLLSLLYMGTLTVAFLEGWEQHVICDFIKLLFTSLAWEGQLVGGSLVVWCTELECARINRLNKEEGKPPKLDYKRNTFLPSTVVLYQRAWNLLNRKQCFYTASISFRRDVNNTVYLTTA